MVEYWRNGVLGTKGMAQRELCRFFYWTFDVGRSMLDVHFFIPHFDSCLLTSFFVSSSAFSAVQFFRDLVVTKPLL